MERDETIAAIKTALKNRSGKPWSVTGGRGTAWGWISISVPPKRLGCARYHEFNLGDECRVCNETRFGNRAQVCGAHICNSSCYRNYITPEDRAELATLLSLDTVHAQGISIPAASDYRREYIARAGGLMPVIHGAQYWD